LVLPHTNGLAILPLNEGHLWGHFQCPRSVPYSEVSLCMYVCPQVVLVCLLWGLKLSPAGMIYPVAIVGLVPIRMFLRRFVFSHAEMEAVSELDTTHVLS
jgi:hypothetical protein